MKLANCNKHQVFQAITMQGSKEMMSFTSWLRLQRYYTTAIGMTTVSKGGQILSCAVRFSDCAPEPFNFSLPIADRVNRYNRILHNYVDSCAREKRQSGFDLLQELS